MIKQGNILTENCDYILQQCNCLTVKSQGLAKDIEAAFPYAAVYKHRTSIGQKNLATVETRDVPGTFKIYEGNPNVVALFGQYRPGKINSPYFNVYPESNPVENNEQREKWFKQALDNFGDYVKETDKEIIINIPFKIGCGLAGGFWNNYHFMIKEFEQKMKVMP